LAQEMFEATVSSDGQEPKKNITTGETIRTRSLGKLEEGKLPKKKRIQNPEEAASRKFQEETSATEKRKDLEKTLRSQSLRRKPEGTRSSKNCLNEPCNPDLPVSLKAGNSISREKLIWKGRFSSRS